MKSRSDTSKSRLIGLGVAALLVLLSGAIFLRSGAVPETEQPQSIIQSAPSQTAELMEPTDVPSAVVRQSIEREATASTSAISDEQEVVLSQQPTVGKVTGRVVDETDQPIPGARVGARFLATIEFLLLDLEAKRDEREVAFAITNSDGYFSVEVPAAHPMTLEVGRTGFGTEHLPGVYAGEKRRIVLKREAIFAGRIVRADNGEPVPDVPMRGWSNSSHATLFKGTSDDEGEFRFEGLSPGAISYEVNPSAMSSPAWVSTELVAGEISEHTIKLDAGITVFGSVTDASTGAAIEGAEIWEGWTGQKRVTSKPDGTYRLVGFGGPGVYDVHVHAPGYGNVAHEFATTGSFSQDIERDFVLEPARYARGRVLDHAGRPVEGAYVAAVHSSFGAGAQLTDWEATRSDTNGRYEISSLHPGLRHALFVRKAGCATVVHGFPANEFEIPSIELPDVVLPAPARLEGVVVDEAGEPRADAKLVLSGWNADAGTFDEGILDGYIGERRVAADSRGRFAFSDLPAGTFQLKVKVPGGGSGAEREVEVTEAAWIRGVQVVIPRGLSIAGRVLDPEGMGVVQAFMTAKSEATGKDHTVMSGAGGAFKFSGLQPGLYQVSARAIFVERGDDRPALTNSYLDEVEAGDEVELTMQEAVRVEGVVKGADGAPYPNAFLSLLDAAGQQVGWTASDDEGAFVFMVPPGGPLRVRAQPTEPSETSQTGFASVGGEADRAQIEIAAAPETGLKLQLPVHSYSD